MCCVCCSEQQTEQQALAGLTAAGPAQEADQLVARVMRFMLFRQGQRPDQPVRRDEIAKFALGTRAAAHLRYQALPIIQLAQVRAPRARHASMPRSQGLAGPSLHFRLGARRAPAACMPSAHGESMPESYPRIPALAVV